jgi:hypothetical protein
MGEFVKREPKKPQAEPEFTVCGTGRELNKGAAAPGNREPKKPYAEPHLTVYGTLVELTKRVGPRGHADRRGGNATRNKTSF